MAISKDHNSMEQKTSSQFIHAYVKTDRIYISLGTDITNLSLVFPLKQSYHQTRAEFLVLFWANGFCASSTCCIGQIYRMPPICSVR